MAVIKNLKASTAGQETEEETAESCSDSGGRYVPRPGQHRQRAVYIKMRPVLGLDIGIFQVVDAWNALKGKKIKTNTENNKKGFRAMHWAVEIGPWTIELGKSPSNMMTACMRSTHVRKLDPSWERESSRIKVGTTVASDEQLANPSSILQEVTRPYHLFTSNCQNAAAKFAITVCEDRPAAFDEIFFLPERRTAFLNMEEPLKLLASLEDWKKTSSKYLRRAVPLYIRLKSFEQMAKGTDERTSENFLALRKTYLEIESAVLLMLTGRSMEISAIDDMDREQEIIKFAKGAMWYKRVFEPVTKDEDGRNSHSDSDSRSHPNTRSRLQSHSSSDGDKYSYSDSDSDQDVDEGEDEHRNHRRIEDYRRNGNNRRDEIYRRYKHNRSDEYSSSDDGYESEEYHRSYRYYRSSGYYKELIRRCLYTPIDFVSHLPN